MWVISLNQKATREDSFLKLHTRVSPAQFQSVRLREAKRSITHFCKGNFAIVYSNWIAFSKKFSFRIPTPPAIVGSEKRNRHYSQLPGFILVYSNYQMGIEISVKQYKRDYYHKACLTAQRMETIDTTSKIT